jgi:RNA polymerase sigma-70 factor (subfamily 1)
MMVDEGHDFLLTMAIAGDSAALATLLDEYEPHLTAYVSRRLPSAVRSQASPEDIVQETNYEACRLIGGFVHRGSRSFFHWLKRIANFRIKRVIERYRVRRTYGVDGTGGDDANVLSALEQVVVYRRTPSASAAAHEFVSAVERALLRLNDDYRRVIHHRYLEGLDVTETAARMNRSNDKVMVLCSRALSALRHQLASVSHYR